MRAVYSLFVKGPGEREIHFASACPDFTSGVRGIHSAITSLHPIKWFGLKAARLS